MELSAILQDLCELEHSLTGAATVNLLCFPMNDLIQDQLDLNRTTAQIVTTPKVQLSLKAESHFSLNC